MDQGGGGAGDGGRNRDRMDDMVRRGEDAARHHPLPPHPHQHGLLWRLRNYLLAGTVVSSPAVITLLAAWYLVTGIDHLVAQVLPGEYDPHRYFPLTVPGLGVVIVLGSLTLVGALTANYAGKLAVGFWDWMIDSTPVVRNVHSAVKQIVETVAASQESAFNEVVLVEYPRPGLWAIAFVVGSTKGEVQRVLDRNVVNVFLPTTPNPTSGFLLFVPRGDLITLDMTVEEGIKMVISGGMVTPPDRLIEQRDYSEALDEGQAHS